jgi:tagaturonate reductase
MKNLSKSFISGTLIKDTEVPDSAYFSIPERILQFGTGVLLRGLPDYFIDKANKQGVFKGRVVVVKSTSQGGSEAFESQDCLFTHFIRGISNGEMVDERMINASISRVLSATQDWQSILTVAENPEVDVVISNTTEVGITLVNESVFQTPPASFPGKLLAVLYHRFLYFKGDVSKGMVIVPTELIPDNGTLLKSVCLELALFNKLDRDFIHWLDTCNYFCDSLVDRIVPGKLSPDQQAWLKEESGYSDQLAILSEPYALWAIEAKYPEVYKRLDFATVNPGVVLAPDISKFRQLKLHLLNGTHTFCSGLAILCGFSTVKEALADDDFSGFVNHLLNFEMIPGVVNDNISEEDAAQFAERVIDRFRNPAIDHLWQNITLNFSAKMKMRNLPLICSFMDRSGEVPTCMSLGFAAMLVYLHSNEEINGKYFYKRDGKAFEIQDDRVPLFNSDWLKGDYFASAEKLLGESSVWGMDLNQLEGFTVSVAEFMKQLLTQNPGKVLAETLKPVKPEFV